MAQAEQDYHQGAQQPWRIATMVSEGAECRHRRELGGSAVAEAAFVQGWEEVRHAVRVDPFSLVKAEIDSVSERLRRGILSGIPVLERAAEYFFKLGAEGKRLRPTMLLLLASALSNVGPPADFFLSVDERPANIHPIEQRRRQQRVAEITEMIHVASLMHDDVIDTASTRRGLQALNSVFGNKVAILAGDFLLARASVTLAALRDSEVIQLLSQVIEDLVTGEILQAGPCQNLLSALSLHQQMTSTEEELLSLEFYARKTFFKTASLMANSCQAIALLGGQPATVAQLAHDYGRHLGLAFQVVDDVLDFTGSALALGKPALNDLRSGLATAPVLFAAQEHPELLPLIQRKFRSAGDVDAAQRLVFASRGIQRARELAAQHASLAVRAVEAMPPAATAHARQCRDALLAITERVLTRTK